MTKRKIKEISAGNDTPPAETLAKGGMEKAGKAWVNTRQTGVDFFYAKRIISKSQWEAGCRLARDSYLAFGDGFAKVDIHSLGGGHDPFEPTETIIAARARYRAAVLGVGQVLAGVLSSLVLGHEKLADYGRRFGYSNGQRITTASRASLILALDALIIHYNQNKDLTGGGVKLYDSRIIK